MNDRLRTRAARRRAGFVYLLLITFSAGGYSTVTALLDGDSQMVSARLTASHSLFVAAVAAMVIGFIVAWAVLGALLYGLMNQAGRLAGCLLLIFVAGGVVTSSIAISQLLPLVTINSPVVIQIGTLTTSVESYRRQLLLSQVFSGLWLFPFGWLVLRSRLAPSLLGMCLIVGGFGYLLAFATAFEPNLNQIAVFRIVSLALGVPALVGEFGMCLWLLFKPASRPARGPVTT